MIPMSFGFVQIGNTEMEFLFDLFLAFVCGLAIGTERELRKKPAGISTHTIVIAGSMLFTFMSKIVVAGDPTRIAAQIVSGIGFLGAGMILKSESNARVQNLTTAASIWYSAAIGMALGFNYHFIAICATFYILLVNRIPHVNNKKSIFHKIRNIRA